MDNEGDVVPVKKDEPQSTQVSEDDYVENNEQSNNQNMSDEVRDRYIQMKAGASDGGIVAPEKPKRIIGKMIKPEDVTPVQTDTEAKDPKAGIYVSRGFVGDIVATGKDIVSYPKRKYEEIKSSVVKAVDTAEDNANKQLKYENYKRVGGNILGNISSNVVNDIGYLGQQAKSSARNIGLTEKQSVKKYGDIQYPGLFGGRGGYAEDLTKDKVKKVQYKRVESFNEDENEDRVADNQGKIRIGKKNPMNIFGGAKNQTLPGEKKKKSSNKDDKKKVKTMDAFGFPVYKTTTKSKKKPAVIYEKPGRKPAPSSMDVINFGVMRDPLSTPAKKSHHKKVPQPIQQDTNPFTNPFENMSGSNKSSGNAIADIFGVNKRQKISKNTNSILDAFGVSRKPITKPLKAGKAKLNSKDAMVSIFSRKKKGRLF
jgi:hypothetical protein